MSSRKARLADPDVSAEAGDGIERSVHYLSALQIRTGSDDDVVVTSCVMRSPS